MDRLTQARRGVRLALRAALCVALGGCATVPDRAAETAGAPGPQRASGGETVRIRWHIGTLAEINQICNAGMPAKFRKTVWGCYRRAFDQCVVYTANEKEDPQLHDTLGHEVRHCFQGNFHP